MELLTVENMSSLLEPCIQVTTSQAVDTAITRSVQGQGSAATAAGEVSLESSMTDDDSGRTDALRLHRRRRHRGADDVFPTQAIHHQVNVE